MTARKPRYVGLRYWYPNTLTGGHVGVYDRDAGTSFDTDDRWQVVCESHATLLSSATLDLARHDGRHPAEWCEECRMLDLREYDVVYVIPIKEETPVNEFDHIYAGTEGPEEYLALVRHIASQGDEAGFSEAAVADARRRLEEETRSAAV